uniref:Chromosome 8 open reading frame 34 n=1 Tax=Cyprinus carpio TaxID=7962 RepID=A0A8C2BBU6_CYPCA
MASLQQSRIQSYLEKNKIGPLFEEMMTKLITETPDHPIPFLIGHLQTKQESPGRIQRTLSGSAALWAESSSEYKGTRRDSRGYEKPWQIHPKKPKKSKSDLAVSNISPPSPESKSLPRSILRPTWDWRTKPESRDFDELNHILQESKKLGKALENLSRSIAVSDDFDLDPRAYNSILRPRVVGEWVGREEEDSDPLAAEMLQPPVPRAKTEGWVSKDNSPVGSLKMETKGKGLKQQQQNHKKLLAAMLSQDSFDSMPDSAPSVTEDEMEDEDDAMELLEDLDDLRMEGVTGLLPSGSKFSQGRSSYCSEPQAKVTLNICSRCARLQGDSLTARPEEEPPPHVPEQAVPEIPCKYPQKPDSKKRHPVWASDVKPIRGTSPQTPRRALQLQDSLFSKELENMGKHLAEVEKDLAKLAEQGKLNRSPNSPHRSLLLTPLFHTTNTLPVLGQTSRPQSPSSLSTKTTGLPLHNTKPTSLVMGRTSPSNPSSRAQTPSGAWTPSRPLTPNSLMMHSLTAGSHGNKERVYGRSRSRPVTPTGQITRPILTPPGLSTTDLYGGLWSTLTEDEFYQQLQAVRKPWRIPSDTESDCLEPPEQDKCEYYIPDPVPSTDQIMTSSHQIMTSIL